MQSNGVESALGATGDEAPGIRGNSAAAGGGELASPHSGVQMMYVEGPVPPMPGSFMAQVAALPQPMVSQRTEDGSELSDGGLRQKVRKPYTITKQRECWTTEEHTSFIEALRLYVHSVPLLVLSNATGITLLTKNVVFRAAHSYRTPRHASA